MSPSWNYFWMIRNKADKCPVTSSFGADIFATKKEAQYTLDWVEAKYPGQYELAKYQHIRTGPYVITDIHTGLYVDDISADGVISCSNKLRKTFETMKDVMNFYNKYGVHGEFQWRLMHPGEDQPT